MKDYENFCNVIRDFFIDDKCNVHIGGAIVILLFAIIWPFYWLYLKIKYLFIKRWQ